MRFLLALMMLSVPHTSIRAADKRLAVAVAGLVAGAAAGAVLPPARPPSGAIRARCACCSAC
ncbi:hypothetical protein M8494_00920 [Serratia ureilytica]